MLYFRFQIRGKYYTCLGDRKRKSSHMAAIANLYNKGGS